MAKIATASNSIMAMWALQPSILELLGENFNLSHDEFWSKYAAHQLAALRLLAVHCMRNNNFMASSLLLKSAADSIGSLSLESASPTATNFEMILKFLARLTYFVELHGDRLFVFLEWCTTIFAQIGPHIKALSYSPQFLTIVTALTQYSLIHNEAVALSCANSLQNLADGIDMLPDEFLKQIARVCCLQMCSVHRSVRDKFTWIFSALPLRISLQEVTGFSGINQAQADHIANLQHWHFSNETVGGGLKGQYFKDFIKHIGFDKNQTFIEQFVQDVFVNCWSVTDVTSSAYAEMSLRDIRPLITWIQWEAAQYCVNNKLRTTLGKPQDTFLKIESLIKANARYLSLKQTTTVASLDAKIANQKSARVLLGFLEALEKAIHNAADGTAFALPAFDKPAKTFFRLNASTCNEVSCF